MTEENDWEPNGCLAAPFGAEFECDDTGRRYRNKRGEVLFSFDEKEHIDDTTIYRGVKIITPMIASRVNSRVMNGFNVFVNLEQRLLDSLLNVEKVILTDECVIFEVTEEDSCWEINSDVFQILH